MRRKISWLLLPIVFGRALVAGSVQDARQFVQEAVTTELAKGQRGSDLIRWG